MVVWAFCFKWKVTTSFDDFLYILLMLVNYAHIFGPDDWLAWINFTNHDMFFPHWFIVLIAFDWHLLILIFLTLNDLFCIWLIVDDNEKVSFKILCLYFNLLANSFFLGKSLQVWIIALRFKINLIASFSSSFLWLSIWILQICRITKFGKKAFS